MDVVKVARVAKFVALFGFFLPWIMVSCSGQALMTASGLDLAMGSFNVTNPMGGGVQHQSSSPDWPVILAALAIGVGIFASFSATRRSGLQVMAGAAAGAMLLAFIGTSGVRDAITHQAQSSSQYAQMGASAAMAVLKVDRQFGFYLTMLSLAVAGGVCLYSLYGREALERAGVDPKDVVGSGLARVSQALAATDTDADLRFWEGMNKDDEDSLHEYLIRYPAGRFVELARAKLGRLAAAPPSAAPAAVSTAAPPPGAAVPPPADVEAPRAVEAPAAVLSAATKAFCGACGAARSGASRFCSECGTAF